MKRLLLVFAMAMSFGCAGTLYGKVPLCCPESEPLLETVTFNAGLAPGVVPMATPRIQPVADALVEMRGAGLICLQEIWTHEAKEAVVEALDLPPENVYYVDTTGVGTLERSGWDMCSPDEIGPVARCAERNCADVNDEDKTICALEMCHSELVDLYRARGYECLNCLTALVGKPISEIEDICVNRTGASRAFDGQNGVMLISRWPLKDPEYLILRSSVANRVAIFARLEIDGVDEPIEVACTHLSTWNELPPSHPDFSDWDQEMIAQVDEISKRLAERAGDRPQIFLGDMNAGPARSDWAVSAAASKVWKRILQLGFRSPVAEAKHPFCTTCRGNTLRGDSTNSYIIDHVLVRDPAGGTELEPVCAHPALDEPVMIEDYDGQPVVTNLSDHDGVVVKFRVK